MADDPVERLPDRGGPAQRLLSARGLVRHFGGRGMFGRGALVRAVDGIDFDLRKGETPGMVGESDCGKSTTSRLIMALLAPTAGEVVFDGETVGGAALPLPEYRRQV